MEASDIPRDQLLTSIVFLHKIVSATKESGTNFIGKAKSSYNGENRYESLISEGVKLGVSSRGIGAKDLQEKASIWLVMTSCYQQI